MLPVDLDRFWADDEISHKENCFFKDAPQVALGIRMHDECVFSELNVEGDPWGIMNRDERIELNKRYNDIAEKTVGIRLLREHYPHEDERHHGVKRIGEVFEGIYKRGHKTGEWLSADIKTPSELEKLLDRVDNLDLHDFMLPQNWENEKKRVFEKYGKKPDVIRSIRGPVTLAMSIYGEENLIFLYYDEPDLFKRFSETICNVILTMSKIMDEEAGYKKGQSPAGFRFYDDNCALLTPEMYEIFGYPILKQAFDYYSPNEDDIRFQHSDSAMAHLLPILSKLNLTGCNFGPTVLVDEIRKYMPKTRIDGCMAPFTFMSNDTDMIIAEVKRDCDMIKKVGTKGLNILTAGSINNGSSLTSMRAVMYAIQTYGRY